jgi:hypothetical protein
MEYTVKPARKERPPALPLGVHVLDYPEGSMVEWKATAKGYRLFKWPALCMRQNGKGEKDRQKTIQSLTSRRRAGFVLGASEPGWYGMTTLTYRTPPERFCEVQRHFRKWKDRVRKHFGKSPHGWFLEFQKRSAPHFHIFWPLTGPVYERLSSEPTKVVFRKGKLTTVCNGDAAEYLSSAWMNIVGDLSDEFFSFQTGGITEIFRVPDAAGRYVAKEANKLHQKEAPYKIPQWWYISPELRAEFVNSGSMKVDEWSSEHGDICLARMWPKTQCEKKPKKQAVIMDENHVKSLRFEFDEFNNYD